MEILTIYEKAKEELEKASAASLQNGHNISSITLIFSDQDVCYTGVNWSRINNDFLIEQTCSEYEAMSRLLFDGNSTVKYIITLDATTQLPVNPCNECQKLMVCLNPANISSTVITGEDSSIILSELNPELLELIPQPEPESEQEQTTENEISSEAAENSEEAESTENTETVPETTEQAVSSEPVDIQQEGSAQSVKAFDTSELEMIFDDWESADESSDSNNTTDNKPFNIDAVTAANESTIKEAIQQQEAAASANMYQQQPMNGMYQQPMNGMYQQPMNGMYQQPMNGMYQQQPMNGMYQQPMNGMYQQQPMNGMYQQPMNGMYQQQDMSGMYQQQPMNGMYQQQDMSGMYQQQPMNGMYQQQDMSGMYQQQPMNGMYQQQPMNNVSMYMPNNGGGMNSMYLPPNQQQNAKSVSKTLNAPDVASASKTITSTSVYSVNSGSSGDNNNAIFKDRLNNLLNTHAPAAASEEMIDDVLQSAKEKKKAAKMDAKYLKKFKNDEFQ